MNMSSAQVFDYEKENKLSTLGNFEVLVGNFCEES